MDKEEQKKLALSIIPYLDAVQKILGPTAQVTMVAILQNDAAGEGSDFVMGNGDFVESAYVLLRSEMSRSMENTIPVPNDNTKH